MSYPHFKKNIAYSQKIFRAIKARFFEYDYNIGHLVNSSLYKRISQKIRIS